MATLNVARFALGVSAFVQVLGFLTKPNIDSYDSSSPGKSFNKVQANT